MALRHDRQRGSIFARRPRQLSLAALIALLRPTAADSVFRRAALSWKLDFSSDQRKITHIYTLCILQWIARIKGKSMQERHGAKASSVRVDFVICFLSLMSMWVVKFQALCLAKQLVLHNQLMYIAALVEPSSTVGRTAGAVNIAIFSQPGHSTFNLTPCDMTWDMGHAQCHFAESGSPYRGAARRSFFGKLGREAEPQKPWIFRWLWRRKMSEVEFLPGSN